MKKIKFKIKIQDCLLKKLYFKKVCNKLLSNNNKINNNLKF